LNTQANEIKEEDEFYLPFHTASHALKVEEIVDGLNFIFQRALENSKPNALQHISSQISSLKSEILGDEEIVGVSKESQPWFRFLPFFQGQLIPVGSENDTINPTWNTPCFSSVVGEVTIENDTATLQISSDKPSQLVCDDFYLIATMENLFFKNIAKKGTDVFNWDLSKASPAELLDIQQNGFRVFLFSKDPEETLKDISTAIDLFQPEFTGSGIDSKVAQLSFEFLSNTVLSQILTAHSTNSVESTH